MIRLSFGVDIAILSLKLSKDGNCANLKHEGIEMKKLLLGVAAIGLSGCSWLGLGDKQVHNVPQVNQYQPQVKKTKDCFGCNSLSRWNIEGAVGPEFFFGGDAISGDQINANIPATATTAAATTTSNVQSLSDVYGRAARYELGASYALNPNRKIIANINYANANADQTTLGTINGTDVNGTLSDFERFGIEAGIRQYARPIAAPLVKSVRPYVSATAGIARIRDIDFVNADPNAAFLAGTTPFIDGGIVPTATGLIGVETPIFNRFTLGIESGVRWTGVPDSDNSVLSAGVPLAGTNNFGNALSVPLQIRGRYRF